jgi:hypothetical protein
MMKNGRPKIIFVDGFISIHRFVGYAGSRYKEKNRVGFHGWMLLGLKPTLRKITKAMVSNPMTLITILKQNAA